ncbi:MAG: 50S ribosomal protein L6 [Robiginitomaculum sp.]|nr:MAG: 50S ribosomal protein L6 [Robiginitomaculum sp.]
MSRIGKNPVTIPAGVTLAQDGQVITAKGPLGELSFTLPNIIEGKIEGDKFSVTPLGSDKTARSMWGMSRTMVSNLIEGVTKGARKDLELRGVGYRAAIKGSELVLQLGYSHEINYTAPEGIKIVVPKPTQIEISGINKQMVGQVAAIIRSYRKPEPYKGKGVRYVGEFVRSKEGKKK